MKLEQFDPAAGAAEVRACHEIYLAGHPIDDPNHPPMSARFFAGWLTLGWTEDRQEVWLARDSQGEPRGWYLLSLPQRDNQHQAFVEPTVHPAHRRLAWAPRWSGTRRAGPASPAGPCWPGTPGTGRLVRRSPARSVPIPACTT